MFDFIPLNYYTPLYYYVMLLFFISFFLRSRSQELTSPKTISSNRITAVLILVFVILYMGYRPISGAVFGDMGTYATSFKNYQNGAVNFFKKDIVFDFFIATSAAVMTVNTFFLFCTLLYVLPLWFACKKWFGLYSFYAFFGLVISFSFWAYGTNGIRNGLATSFFLFALSRSKLKYKIIWMLLSIGVHKTMFIPSVAFILAFFYSNSKYYFYGWLFSIPLSIISGSFWEGIFASFIADDRVRYLTQGNENNDNFSPL